MPVLIDGYNLAWALGETGQRLQRGDLTGARDRLLHILADRLGDRAPHTTVVFDARQPPTDLPRRATCRGIRVLFAVTEANADELIIRRIAEDTAPRRLLVVSSDREIRDAARLHGATSIGVGAFLGKLGLSPRSGRRGATRPAPPAPDAEDKPHTAAAPDYWWRQFEHVADTPGLDEITGPGELDDVGHDSTAGPTGDRPHE